MAGEKLEVDVVGVEEFVRKIKERRVGEWRKGTRESRDYELETCTLTLREN
jgi:hypothetical protein